MFEKIYNLLSKRRFSMSDEKVVQKQIADVFLVANLSFQREYHLDAHNIIDFFVHDEQEGIGIEVKIKGQKRAIYKQLTRYAAFDEIDHIIILSSLSLGLPSSINGKPIHILNLSRAWL